jgi:hypothetical protein
MQETNAPEKEESGFAGTAARFSPPNFAVWAEIVFELA